MTTALNTTTDFVDPPVLPKGVLVSIDIRDALQHLDPYPLKHYALGRYQALKGMDPDHTILYTLGGPEDQQMAALQHQVIDDYIIHTINGFEHTWIQRDLSHLTRKELDFFELQFKAKQALFQAVQLQPEYAGQYAHYQRINDTIFLVIPTF